MSIVKYKYDLYEYGEGKFSWVLYETESELVVGAYDFEDDCIAVMKFMTNGGAFDGFTPTFFVRNLKCLEPLLNS